MTNRILPFITLVFLSTLFSIVIGDDGVAISEQYPLVVSTWPFKEAVRAAWRAVDGDHSAVDAVVEGCSACEELRCDGTVGPGGSPDENGETTIDALIMNGVTMEVGAVAAMRFVKDGIRAAKLVMQHTKHTLLVGEKASAFAIAMGLPGPDNLSSADSIRKWSKWKKNHCQPNFWKDVVPSDSCGPYHAKARIDVKERGCSTRYLMGVAEPRSSLRGHVAVGTSTNGATYKIPGRAGDGPIAGSSAYAVSDSGACVATGDGDIMMRFLPCYQVVESMRLGMEPGLLRRMQYQELQENFQIFWGLLLLSTKMVCMLVLVMDGHLSTPLEVQ